MPPTTKTTTISYRQSLSSCHLDSKSCGQISLISCVCVGKRTGPGCNFKDPNDQFSHQRAALTFIEYGRIARTTFEMCPDPYDRKRRSIDYDNFYGYDGEEEQPSDDFMDQHYDELKEEYDAYKAEENARKNASEYMVAGFRRVHHGEEGFLPFFVSIRYSKGSRIHFCGGAMYDENTVISAAHCFADRGTIASKFRVTMGHKQRKWRYARREDGYQEFRIKEIIMHKRFQRIDFFNDIAIVKLSKSAKFTEFVRPICLLPDCYELPPGTTAIVGGWGKNEGHEATQVFNFATALVFESRECTRFAGADYLRRDGSQLCIGYKEGGIDTCHGDSGGPAIVNIDGKWTLIGVVSYGVSFGQFNKPGVFTNIIHRSVSGFLKANL